MTAAPVEVLLTGPVLAELRTAARAAEPKETGGLLLGWWNSGDAIVVRHAIEVPDPQATPTSWIRRPRAAKAALARALTALGHPLLGYVGDWHSHLAPRPASWQDQTSLAQTSLQYQRPVLLLIHLPGDMVDMAAAHAGEPRPAKQRHREEGSPV
jgi:Prokaryotic homologs of the JAB domain